MLISRALVAAQQAERERRKASGERKNDGLLLWRFGEA